MKVSDFIGWLILYFFCLIIIAGAICPFLGVAFGLSFAVVFTIAYWGIIFISGRK